MLCFSACFNQWELDHSVPVYKLSQFSSPSTPSFTVSLQSSTLKVYFQHLHILVCAHTQSTEHNTLEREA